MVILDMTIDVSLEKVTQLVNEISVAVEMVTYAVEEKEIPYIVQEKISYDVQESLISDAQEDVTGV